MDGTRFDRITQRLTERATRRRLVSGLLGGAAMLTGVALAGTGDAEARKGGKGKGRGKGKSKGKPKGKPKAAFCHKTGNGYTFIEVGAPARKAHLKKGDTECVADPCNTLTRTCNEDGACGATPAVSEEPIPCGVNGACVDGACVEEPV